MKTTDLREPQRDDSARSAPDWVPVSGVFTRPRLIAEQQHDVASFGLRFQQLATQAAAVHGVGILATLQRVAGRRQRNPPCMGFMMSSVISSKRPWIAEQDRYRPRCFKCGTLPHHLVSGRPTGPDQHPTYVGKCEAGKTGPIFLTASKPGGSAVHARPVPSRISLRPPRRNRQVFSVAPSGTRPSVT